MTDEEYEQIKEDEKNHLRKRKELKQAARRLRRTKKLQEAFEKVNGAQDKLDENSTLVRRLSEETARSAPTAQEEGPLRCEARLDLALEASGEPTADPKARARDLVRRLREEMNAENEGADDPARDDPARDDPARDDPARDDPARDDRPDKTIGRAT